MATSEETLPKSESVVKKEPLPVIESPQKKVVLIEKEEEIAKREEMEVDLTEEDNNVISPDNQT
jgi:hypothetical protein